MREFWHYLTLGYLYRGAQATIEISVFSLLGGLLFGTVLAELRLSRFRVLRAISATYTFVIRGTPLLLQLLFLFDALPSIGIVLKPVPTAVIGFTLNEAAFFGEIIRGGIAAVGRNQLLAAESLGMSPRVTRRRVVLPQAMRAILPSLGNEFIGLIKSTSLASVIAVSELTQRSQLIASQTFVFFPVLTAAAVLYLGMTSTVAVAQWLLERRFSLEHKTTLQAPSSEIHRWLGFGIDRTPIASPAPVESRSASTRVSAPAAAFVDAEPERAPMGSVLVAAPAAAPGDPGIDPRFVSCVGVRKRYQHQEVLKGIDLTVARGEVVAVMGSSGSGKSTLLRLINHLETLDEGAITVDGESVGYDAGGHAMRSHRQLARSRADARIGMVFQHFNLFEHLTALENVTAAPVRVHGTSPDVARERAMDLLGLVGLADHADKRPHKLSGGQQQRVAIARALAIEPKLMLFDEPTSALDPELVGEVLTAIRRLAETGMTMIVVSHEVRFALEVADRMVFIERGTVVEEGPPADVIRNPQAPQTRRFLQSVQ